MAKKITKVMQIKGNKGLNKGRIKAKLTGTY
jgi:hypothetical protein